MFFDKRFLLGNFCYFAGGSHRHAKRSFLSGNRILIRKCPDNLCGQTRLSSIESQPKKVVVVVVIMAVIVVFVVVGLVVVVGVVVAIIVGQRI